VTTSAVFLVLSTFLASAVEVVETLTIVLAIGVTRGWRATLIGVGAATIALAAVVAALGPALTIVPIERLRLVVGALLLVFGLQWLRKAILRASGFKALHDEEEAYAEELEHARAAGHERRAGLDWYAFTLCFKATLLEGLEVAFIVLTFGASQGSIPLAALGAGAAVVVTASIGAAVRVMLTTFGIFWATEGAGATWPGGDVSLLGVLAFVALSSIALVAQLKRERLRIAVA
jgi:uncharacterized membrane protein